MFAFSAILLSFLNTVMSSDYLLLQYKSMTNDIITDLDIAKLGNTWRVVLGQLAERIYLDQTDVLIARNPIWQP